MFMVLCLICIFSMVLYVQSLALLFPGAYFENGIAQTIAVADSGDVFDLLSPRCDEFKSEFYCHEAMDVLSYYMYGFACYTPRLPHRTREDITTSRAQILANFIIQFQYTRYCEIGCDLDLVFKTISPLVYHAVGVDPARGGTVRTTSDAFFAQNKESFDLIFLDGDHTARQTMMDVENALQVLNPGGTIVLHDCNPWFEYRQHRSSSIYNGDVWKVVTALRARTDVEVVTVDVDHGIGVVRKRPNLHPLPPSLAQKQQLAIRDSSSVGGGTNALLDAFTYADLELHREELLRLMTMADLQAWLSEEIGATMQYVGSA